MMCRIIGFIVVLILGICPHIDAQSIDFERHEIDEEGGYIRHNFRKFYKRKKQKLTLIVKNTGQLPLQLESLELSCDCLKAKKLPKLPIPAGATTKIRIIHKAKDIGAFDLFAKIKSNAKNYPELWIKLQGEVLKKP